ncbi:hypothetical protein BD779DRAFT_1505756 [Infundibulicybe gibba]|nr:hypothetical protein BD779DRAFT_1505756 [Infundibulicybe gibba]
MATALHPVRNDTTPNVQVSLYPRALINELDFKDNRYPSLSSAQSRNGQRSSTLAIGTPDRSAWENSSNSNDGPSARSFEPTGGNALTSGWVHDQRDQADRQPQQPQSHGEVSADVQSIQSQSQSQEPPRSVLSYALPPGAARRVVERYSLDNNPQRTPSRGSVETRPTAVDSTQNALRSRATPQAADQNLPTERPASIYPSSPRHPSLPVAGASTNGSFSPPIMPATASPTYNPPVAPKHRAFPQQPTYITPPATPNPLNPVYSRNPPIAQEEVCVECAMRDQDMADVDVTSPGIWERQSDVHFEDLKRREMEDAMNGVISVDDSSRPRARGGRLTEQNLKLWLSVNPRESASRQQTINTYIRSQRTLLEAEALAHSRAMQESKQIDNRMRDAYAQLRRSAYDTGSSAAPADDAGGVRIKPPQSSNRPVSTTHARTHSREVTLLENGLIVEHVNVRKEEREAKERQRKEERRARKSSRSSGVDVTSIISGQSYGPYTDSGLGLHPQSRYSQASSNRPLSSLTAPLDRPDLPHAYSQASFSEIHSLGSASPRRTRFLGIKNLSAGWRSQDSLAQSGITTGSMVNMHVALQREAQNQGSTSSPVNLNTPRRSQVWPTTELADVTESVGEKPKKKKGLAKIWRIVTGSSKYHGNGREPSQSYERNEDDLPLAPPPPLSYLVSRGPGELLTPNGRHASTPSLPSIISPKGALSSPGMSISTAPSSILPSPTSSRLYGPEIDTGMERINHPPGGQDQQEESTGRNQTISSRGVHPVTSEPDIRRRSSQSPTPIPIPTLAQTPSPPQPSSRPASILSRDKSLPPLPGEPRTRTLTNVGEARPTTMYTYEPNRQLPPGSQPPHDFLPPQAPFRAPDSRRQSFSGMTSRPNLVLQTLPATKHNNATDQRRSFGPNYNEFGHSQRSLGRFDHLNSPAPSAKRKSKFGLSSLLGRKTISREPEPMHESMGIVHSFPTRRSPSDGQDDHITNGYATSTSRHSALSMSGPAARMSVTSRKALEDLVAQDSDFVAYRYPSSDQRLDLLR